MLGDGKSTGNVSTLLLAAFYKKYEWDVNTEAQSGEALLIQTPGGRFVLINGGPSATRLSDALGQRLPTFDRRLDYLVVTGVEDVQLQALPTGPVTMAMPMSVPLRPRKAL